LHEEEEEEEEEDVIFHMYKYKYKCNKYSAEGCQKSRSISVCSGRISVKRHKYASCEWALLKRFLRSEVRCQAVHMISGLQIFSVWSQMDARTAQNGMLWHKMTTSQERQKVNF